MLPCYNINKFHLNCKNAPRWISFAGIHTIFIPPRSFLIIKHSKWLVVIPHCWVVLHVFTFGQAPFPPLIKVGLELIGFVSWIHVSARLKGWRDLNWLSGCHRVYPIMQLCHPGGNYIDLLFHCRGRSRITVPTPFEMQTLMSKYFSTNELQYLFLVML